MTRLGRTALIALLCRTAIVGSADEGAAEGEERWPSGEAAEASEAAARALTGACETSGRPAQPGADQVGAVQLRLLSFNVYWMNAQRGEWDGIAGVIDEIAPDIASIQEAPMKDHQDGLLAALENVSGEDYAFVPRFGNASDEWWWDGAILYRPGKWTLRDGGMIEFRQSWSTQWGREDDSPRGVSWAALQHRNGSGLLVYGTHPVCCMGDWPADEAIGLAVEHMKELQARWSWPVVIMGDFNAKRQNPGMDGLRTGNASRGSLFHHTASTYHYEIDHIFTQTQPFNVVEVLQEQTWCNFGGSDHAPVVVDMRLLSEPRPTTTAAPPHIPISAAGPCCVSPVALLLALLPVPLMLAPASA